MQGLMVQHNTQHAYNALLNHQMNPRLISILDFELAILDC